MQGIHRTPVHGCSRSEVWWHSQEVCRRDEKEEPGYFSVLMTLFQATIWICICILSFIPNIQIHKVPEPSSPFPWILQQTPRAPIAPAALESDYCTKLQHASALKSFHWEYFSRLHSDSKYDMLSFRARCFHCSVDQVLTKTPSLNAMWQPLSIFSNRPNDIIPEIKDSSLWSHHSMTPRSEGLVPASLFSKICFQSYFSKENTSANLTHNNSLVILTFTV